MEKHYNVEYAQDLNLASKMSGCNKRYIRIFENIPKEAEHVILNVYGIENNTSTFIRVMKNIAKYNHFNTTHNHKAFGFLMFDFTGIGMSGDSVDKEDISFVNDTLLVMEYLRTVYPKLKIIISADCFATNITSRCLADLNIDCYIKNRTFDYWNVEMLCMTAPYISTKEVKKIKI